ncbi:BnaCnng72030D, partial [Brassica napus]
LIHFWEAKNTASGHCDARIFKMFLTEIYLFCYTLEIVDQNEPKLYLQWHMLFKAMPWGGKNWYGGLFCGAGSGCGGGGVIDVDMIFVNTDDFQTDYFARSRDRGCRQICCKFLMLVVAFHNNLNSKYLLERQNHHQPI